jgi:hypothetical protein
MTTRNWTDQPVELEEADVMFCANIDGRIVEVRAGDAWWYVTVGNLWGSETLRVGNAREAFRVLNQIVETPSGGQRGIPDFATKCK